MFKISFVAVPAFNLVDPVSSSGPRLGEITTPGRHAFGIFRNGLKQTRTVFAWRRLASRNAPQTNGVVPLAAIPTTTCVEVTPRNDIARAPAAVSSSAPSTD